MSTIPGNINQAVLEAIGECVPELDALRALERRSIGEAAAILVKHRRDISEPTALSIKAAVESEGHGPYAQLLRDLGEEPTVRIRVGR